MKFENKFFISSLEHLSIKFSLLLELAFIFTCCVCFLYFFYCCLKQLKNAEKGILIGFKTHHWNVAAVLLLDFSFQCFGIGDEVWCNNGRGSIFSSGSNSN